MSGRLHELLSVDHARLDALLEAALRSDGTVDEGSYAEFRRGLLRHIGIEERILFPLMRKAVGESPLMRQLHRDHALLSALLVPPPTRTEIDAIRRLLSLHNPLEENSAGLYDQVEVAAGSELPEILSRIAAYPPPRVAPYADNEILRRTIAQLTHEVEEGRRGL